jgi:hypothetical protein
MRSGRDTRGSIQLLLLVVLVTRVGALYFADHPDNYGTPGTKIVGDVDVYQRWADEIVDEGRAPYSEVAIEYPPGVLPFTLAAKIGPDSAYRKAFILLMLLFDLAGLWGIYSIGRRRGTLLGAWLWAFAVPAIGPILYLRLDLIPAVATIWALERASRGSWAASGGWLGFGIVAKIYPLLILPLVALMARRKFLVIAGAAAVVVVALAPFVRSLDSLFTSVIEYHADRGLQVESSWAAGLQLAEHFGYPIGIEYTFGAFHLVSAVSPTLKTIADGASLAALGAGIAFAIRFARRDDSTLMAEVSFATMALVLAFGTVFSPQFMVWLLALAAIVACNDRSHLVVPALAVLPLCALTQFIYPFAYDQLIIGGDWRLVARLAVAARDAGVLAIGVAAFWILAKRRWSEDPSETPVTREPEPQPI